MFMRLILLALACASLGSAQEDLSWIRSFTAPATPENILFNSVNRPVSEAGRQNQLNWDPRFEKLLRGALPQRQYFWFDHGKFTALPDLVHLFIGVPGQALLDENRYALVTGCVPHDCGDRGFLWIDTASSSKPLLIFAATGIVHSDAAVKDQLIHLRLFASQERQTYGWHLPPEFKTRLSQWWNQTTQVWTGYLSEKVVLVTLIEPSGEQVDISPDSVLSAASNQGNRAQ